VVSLLALGMCSNSANGPREEAGFCFLGLCL
jgi:hypothetical protein